MASPADLLNNEPFRGLIVGYPGAGKTGALASLIDAGFKLRVIDFEGNFKPMLEYAMRDKLLAPGAVDIVTLRDQMMVDPAKGFLRPAGTPTAFKEALRLAGHWTYTKPNGEKVDLGRANDWGLDTFLVVDGMTGAAEAAMRWETALNNGTRGSITSTMWGNAAEDVMSFVQVMKTKPHNMLWLAHLRMLGPADFINQSDLKKDNADMLDAKMDAIRAGLIATKLFPVAVTKNQSPLIHKEFPIMLLADKYTSAGKLKRVLRTSAGEELDLKFPVRGAPAEVPLESGLAQLVKLYGVPDPAPAK